MDSTNEGKLMMTKRYLCDSSENYWLVDDPIQWCLNNINSELLRPAQKAVENLSVPPNQLLAYVSRKTDLSLVEVNLERESVILSNWRTLENTRCNPDRYKPFFKAEKLARPDVTVIYWALKRRDAEPKMMKGSCFLYGQGLLSSDMDLDRYIEKFDNRFFLDPDDEDWVDGKRNSPTNYPQYGNVRWFELKVAWRRFPTKNCMNCDTHLVMIRFGRFRYSLLNSMTALEYLCPNCRSFYKTTRLELSEAQILNKVFQDCNEEKMRRFGYLI